MLNSPILQVPIAEIRIPEERQREDIGDISGLMRSMQDRGLLNPIILEGRLLRAGFRRYNSAKRLGWLHIAARDFGQLSILQQQVVELEENFHRKDLTWQETGKGIRKIHDLMQASQGASWTIEKTAQYLGIDSSYCSRHLLVQKAARSSPELLERETLNTAFNEANRARQRKEASLVESITHSVRTGGLGVLKSDDEVVPGESAAPITAVIPTRRDEPSLKPASSPVLHQDFKEWAATYSGPRFNLIHCDFPYGVGMQRSQQGNTDSKWETYQDTPDTYWSLLEAFAQHFNNFCASSAHIIFWLAPAELVRTLVFFNKHLPQVSFYRNPLIWHKADGRGIVANPEQEPRHSYEMALFGTVGRRPIVRVKTDSFSYQLEKTIHQSEKPLSVVHHFLSMLVDENTWLLDPTCGSGTALRAATDLGADRVLGLESNELYWAAAKKAYEEHVSGGLEGIKLAL